MTGCNGLSSPIFKEELNIIVDGVYSHVGAKQFIALIIAGCLCPGRVK